MKIKPGIQTTEFYVTMLPVVISGLMFTGIIEPNDTDYVISLVKDIIAGVVALFSIISYVLSRSHLKREVLRLQEKEDTKSQKLQKTTTVSELG